LVSLSRVVPNKRIDLSIWTLRVLRERGGSYRLVVAGDGDAHLMRRLRKLAAELDVLPYVEFTGQVVDRAKTRLLFGSDILLLPSDNENFGIVVAEAAAHGLPVLASAQVEAATLLPRSVCTQLSDVSAEAMADAVESMARLNRREVFYLARGAAERLFSWQVVAERWTAVLDDTAGKR